MAKSRLVKSRNERMKMLTTELDDLEAIDHVANKALNAVGAGRVGGLLGTHEFKLLVFMI